MYGFPRLKQAVGRFPAGQELIDSVLEELDAFTGPGAEQEDDITMVTLQRSSGESVLTSELPGEPPTTSDPAANGRLLAEFELASEAGNEREAMERVAVAVAEVGLEAARLDRLKTAVAEATMNAMEHGNEYRPDRPVSIRVLQSEDSLRVEVSDHGGGGELAPPETPDIAAKLEGSQKPRGWGLFLIEKMVDEAHVRGGEGGHTLELSLRLKGGEDGDE
jgi:anti-sigma regulatory factor (Ser/Thr protein kinase)